VRLQLSHYGEVELISGCAVADITGSAVGKKANGWHGKATYVTNALQK
jgi:hypothetical protein